MMICTYWTTVHTVHILFNKLLFSVIVDQYFVFLSKITIRINLIKPHATLMIENTNKETNQYNLHRQNEYYGQAVS